MNYAYMSTPAPEWPASNDPVHARVIGFVLDRVDTPGTPSGRFSRCSDRVANPVPIA